MTCEEVAARVTDYLDGALSATRRAHFEAHVEDCEHCRVYVAQFAHTLNALGALRADDAAPDGLGALLDAFRAHAE
jgi:anti-sigma factor RsiW